MSTAYIPARRRVIYPNLYNIIQSGASTTWTNFRDIDQNAFSEIGPDIPVIDQNFAKFFIFQKKNKKM